MFVPSAVTVCSFDQERELVLKRIAEDRRSQQEKAQTEATAETSPSSGQGQRLGGRVETSVDNHCVLMVRDYVCFSSAFKQLLVNV